MGGYAPTLTRGPSQVWLKVIEGGAVWGALPPPSPEAPGGKRAVGGLCPHPHPWSSPGMVKG
jgi:hypothetical protein